MRITEILTEDQIAELNLPEGLGSAIEKGVGALAKGAGYISGIGKGMSNQYQQGKARAVAGIGGTLARPPAPENPSYTQALRNYQTTGNVQRTTQNVPADPNAMRAQARDLRKQAGDLEAQASKMQTSGVPRNTQAPAARQEPTLNTATDNNAELTNKTTTQPDSTAPNNATLPSSTTKPTVAQPTYKQANAAAPANVDYSTTTQDLVTPKKFQSFTQRGTAKGQPKRVVPQTNNNLPTAK